MTSHQMIKKMISEWELIIGLFEIQIHMYCRSQILECPSIGEYWSISGVPVLPENVIFTFFVKLDTLQSRWKQDSWNVVLDLEENA